MRWGALLLLAGCYGPSPESGAPCTTDDQCPSVYQCLAGHCGGGADDGGTTRDGAAVDARADGRVADGATCPNGFVANSFGTCTRAGTGMATWTAAEQACEGYGAHLVVVQTLAEATALPSPSWVGGSDLVTAGTFLAVTGGPLPFTNWGSGQPSTNTSLRCIQVGGPTKQWIVAPCGFPFPYVCEYDGVPANPAAY